MFMGRLIFQLKARKMISNGYIYHLIRVKDSSSKIPTLVLDSLVNELPKVFREDLPEVLTERKIDFGIDLLFDTQTIFILLYSMAPTELKEFKRKLKDLLDMGFIKPIISPQSALVLFMKK